MKLEDIVEPLLQWYDRNARVLPWRENPEPYRVWVSEIMLQQTRVEAVKPYYQRFLAELPTIAHLAAAPEDKLLKLWEGLGYYNRVRNLQKAARIIMEKYGGEVPASFQALRSLPGIGEYTAGAISSIAFQIPMPAVDGNVLRVICRLQASLEDILDAKVKKRVQKELSQILPERVGDFNQSLMELGATVCLPGGEPRCGECPLKELCQAYEQGVAAELPVKAEKKPRRVENKTVLILTCQGRAALRRRCGKGLLAGMWELPNGEGFLDEAQARVLLEEWGSPACGKLQILPEAKHIFTHVEWRMKGYSAEVSQAANAFAWVDLDLLERDYALPFAFKAYLDPLRKLLKG